MLSAYVCCEHTDLPEELKEEYSERYFEDNCSVLVVEYDGIVIAHETDHCDQASNYFWRHYNWVDLIIQKAYELGIKDGETGNYVIED